MILFLLISIALLGVTAVSAQGADKTTLCHKPGAPAEGTIVVATSAVASHLGHGDVVGACSGGTAVDACIAINDPALDRTGIAAVELDGLIFKQFTSDPEYRVDIRANTLDPKLGVIIPADPFEIYVEVPEGHQQLLVSSPRSTPPFDMLGCARTVELALPDMAYSALDNYQFGAYLAGWRDGPQYLGWGLRDATIADDVYWIVSCIDPEEPK